MTAALEPLCAQLLDAARKAGAEAADAIALSGETLSVDLHKAALDHAERAEGIDIGLRVLIGRRQACVSSSDTRAETIAALAERAVAMAREAPEDPWIGLAEPGELATGWDLAALEMDDGAEGPGPEWLEDQGRQLEAAAFQVPGVTQVQGAGAGWGRTHVHLAATNGFSGGYSRSSTSLHCTAIAGEGLGMERDYAAESRVFAADMPDAAGIGRLAGERAVANLGATKPPTGAYPVLFDERIAGSLIGHLVAAVNGASVARGSSWLADGIDTRILPEGMDLIEDPLRTRTSGSRPFDAEGLSARPRFMVRDGVLTGWTLDLATGRQLGMPSTASAARGVGSAPSPSTGNLVLTPGTRSRAELLREMGTGLLVTSMIGASINPTTGDYSRGASGFWVENGEIVRPVNECTVAGNLRRMLATLVPANDARQHLSRVIPSLLVEGLTIAGG
ncbi:TldD/PmbA family protein [Paroceanicella profunda]|uniref:TldD/PmbA family protein n=1 Tax=Paroceanicella profunda TaxID=2579971 RepID=A0A5B8FWY0_9RHOB|nr:TldD/PmbA family protein [Paroceanicella profunda]QDL90932.1 TldD/PmbA family protein [Paroceanicella profunda]